MSEALHQNPTTKKFLAVRQEGVRQVKRNFTFVDFPKFFSTSKTNISEHIRHIFGSDELDKSVTVRKFRTVQTEGARETARNNSLHTM